MFLTFVAKRMISVKGFEGPNMNKHAGKRRQKENKLHRKQASRWGDDELDCWKILSSFGCKTAAGDFA